MDALTDKEKGELYRWLGYFGLQLRAVAVRDAARITRNQQAWTFAAGDCYEQCPPLDHNLFMDKAEPKLREIGAKVMYHGIDNHTVSPTEGQWFILGADGGVQDGNQWRAALKYVRGERYWSSLEGR